MSPERKYRSRNVLRGYLYVVLGFVIAALYWLLYAFGGSLVLKERGFFGALFAPTSAELWQHLPFMAALIVAGVLAQLAANKRARAEETWRESEEKYRKLVETMPGGVTTTDFDGVITYASPQAAALHGLERAEDLVGRNFFEFLAPEVHAKAAAEFQNAIAEGGIRNLELTFLGKDGASCFGEVNATLLRDAEGKPTAFIATTRDITERKRAEEVLRRAHNELEDKVRERTAALERANEELKTFTYLVSHDMRAPLINLKGYAAELRAAVAAVRPAVAEGLGRLEEAQSAAAAAALQEDIPEALGFIDASVERMDSFIEAMLKLSRLGRRELTFARVDTKALVEKTLRTLAYQLEAQDVTVTCGPLPAVTADRTSLEQIMANLLTNAVLYLDPARPGEVDVSGETNHEEVTFRVRDNGCGIASEDLRKVFEPFARVGERSVPGEGMGLAYVHSLVRRHGGRIWCESEPGVGTTFAFTIPNGNGKGADYA